MRREATGYPLAVPGITGIPYRGLPESHTGDYRNRVPRITGLRSNDDNDRQLGSNSPYAQVVGAEFQIAGEVNAYGVYEGDLARRQLSYVTLIPGVGIAGPEIAFKIKMPKGARLKVLSAWRESGVLSHDVYYVVALSDSGLPQGTPVRIELSRGNDANGSLNQKVYERVGS
ncbi:MAG: hypothetical protein ACRETF_02405 [Nevskiaceae bacterium]